MEFSLIKVLSAAVFFSQAQAFCGNTKLDDDLSRASVKAGEWLMDKQRTFKMAGHESAWAFHSLRLVGYSVPKHGAEHLRQEIEKTGLSSIPGGRLALYILGVISSCKDPRNFNKQDLVAALKGNMSSYGTVQGFNHPFQLGLAVLALCTSGESVNNSHVNLLIEKTNATSDGSVHSIDTLSLGTVALSCIEHAREQKKRNSQLLPAIKSTAKQLTDFQKKNNGKFGNIFTTSLAVQALLAAGVKWEEWDCKATMRNLLSMQDKDGAFTNVLGTIHAIPALLGKLPYDVKNMACPKEGKEVNGQRVTKEKGDRKLCGDLSRASVKAGVWLREQMDEQGTFKFCHASAWAFNRIRRVGYSVPKVSNFGAEYLKEEIEKTRLSSIAGGRLALYILGVISSCKDPRNFNKQDLVAVLKKKMSSYGTVQGFNHPFQLALAVVALCTSGESVDNSHVNLLIEKIKPTSDGSAHSIDTLSMGTVALSCIKRQQKKRNRKLLLAAISSASKQLRAFQKKNNGKFCAEATTSLAVQALLDAGVKGKKWDRKASITNLLSMQDKHDAFINILDTIHARPDLIGPLPNDANDLSCLKEGNGGEQPNITVCMRLEFETNLTNLSPPAPQNFTVPNGINGHCIMKLARARTHTQHACYNFTVELTSWGNFVTSICGVFNNQQSKLYWMIYIDPGRKLAQYGIDSLKPSDGQCLVFVYKKVEW